MKHLIILITIYFLAGGCTPKISAVQHVDPVPVEITKKVTVTLSDNLNIPARDHSGDIEASTTDPTFWSFDWGDVLTDIEIIPPRNHGERQVVKVRTRTPKQDIPVSLTDEVDITLRDTVEIDYPPPRNHNGSPIVLPAPPVDNALSSWLFWGFGALAAFLFAFYGVRKKQHQE